MGLTVREIWQMEKFQSFRLAAGRKGLDNEIENIGILDYEYAVEDVELQQKWAFGRKGFVYQRGIKRRRGEEPHRTNDKRALEKLYGHL